jgi:lipoate-protein ligase A
MDAWRLILDPPSPAGYNMAVDETLANACRRGLTGPTLRLYEWDRPAISLGYFQHAERVLNFDNCRAAGVPVVRRTTGGRAVVHHRELTYSVVAPVPYPRFPPTIRGTFAVIARALADALAKVGLAVEIRAGESPRQRFGAGSPLCFDATSRSEVTINGKKVVGSAQRRWNSAFLQHGSIILAPPPDNWTEWFYGPVPAADVMAERRLPGPDVDVDGDALRRALRTSFEQALGIRLTPGGLSPTEAAYVAETSDTRDLTTTIAV